MTGEITNKIPGALTSVWAGHLSEEVRRRFYKNWHTSKQKAFTKYQKAWTEAGKDRGEQPMAAEIARAKKFCQVIRAICHTYNRRSLASSCQFDAWMIFRYFFGFEHA